MPKNFFHYISAFVLFETEVGAFVFVDLNKTVLRRGGEWRDYDVDNNL